jgi:hypothetical protein
VLEIEVKIKKKKWPKRLVSRVVETSLKLHTDTERGHRHQVELTKLTTSSFKFHEKEDP